MLALLHQTHIVSLFHAGEEGHWQYFAMPYIDGAALDKVVKAARDTAKDGQTPTLATLASELAPRSQDAPAPGEPHRSDGNCHNTGVAKVHQDRRESQPILAAEAGR